jgi:predicted lipoprotein with Yx(FWY)xxD motif
MTRSWRISGLVFGVSLAVAVIGAPTAAMAKAKGTTISTVKTKLGRVVSSHSGRVMFEFEKDAKNKSKCKGSCTGVWPAVTSKKAARAAGKIKAKHLGRTKHGQVTYYGHPLYFYVANTGHAKTKGDGTKQFGAKWFLLSPKGKAVKPDKPDGGYHPVVPTSAPTINAQQEGTTTTQPVLANADGFALYALGSETGSNFLCTESGGCVPTWTPILTDAANDAPIAGTGVMQGLLSTADRTFGTTTVHQVTYNGHPLYTYVGDTSANSDQGQWQSTAGHFWGTVFPDGSINQALQP